MYRFAGANSIAKPVKLFFCYNYRKVLKSDSTRSSPSTTVVFMSFGLKAIANELRRLQRDGVNRVFVEDDTMELLMQEKE